MNKKTIKNDFIKYTHKNEDHNDFIDYIAIVNKLEIERINKIENTSVNNVEYYVSLISKLAVQNNHSLIIITPVSNPYRYETYLSIIREEKSFSDFKSSFIYAQELFNNDFLNKTEEVLLDLEKEYPENGLISAFLARVYTEKKNFKKVRKYEIDIIEKNYRTHRAKKELNKVLLNMEDKDNGVYVYDFYNYFYHEINQENTIGDQYFEDYLHPSNELYKLMGEKIYEFMKENRLI